MQASIKTPAYSSAGCQAFAVLAREHHRGLLIFARALSRNESIASDLAQEAFLTAWRNMENFDATRDFGAWLRGIDATTSRKLLQRAREALRICLDRKFPNPIQS